MRFRFELGAGSVLVDIKKNIKRPREKKGVERDGEEKHIHLMNQTSQMSQMSQMNQRIQTSQLSDVGGISEISTTLINTLKEHSSKGLPLSTFIDAMTSFGVSRESGSMAFDVLCWSYFYHSLLKTFQDSIVFSLPSTNKAYVLSGNVLDFTLPSFETPLYICESIDKYIKGEKAGEKALEEDTQSIENFIRNVSLQWKSYIGSISTDSIVTRRLSLVSWRFAQYCACVYEEKTGKVLVFARDTEMQLDPSQLQGLQSRVGGLKGKEGGEEDFRFTLAELTKVMYWLQYIKTVFSDLRKLYVEKATAFPTLAQAKDLTKKDNSPVDKSVFQVCDCLVTQVNELIDDISMCSQFT